ncbi:hypothetical protein HY546_02005 [archaeon]|nr:hypothetical protein [archaeon]
MKKIYAAYAVFLAILSVAATYLGYAGLIKQEYAIFAVMAAAAISLFTCQLIGNRKVKMWPAIIPCGIVLTVSIYVSFPSMVFPHGAGDFSSMIGHAKKAVDTGFLNTEGNRQPQIAYGIIALIYTIIPNVFVVGSLLMITLHAFSALGVYLFTQPILGEKNAVFASVLYGFSITGFFMMEQAFLPQLFAQFFFISSLVFLIEKEKHVLFASNIGVASYLPYLGIYFVIAALFSLKHKKIWPLAILIAANFTILPELSRIFLNWVKVQSDPTFFANDVPFRTTLLPKGGILTPPLVSLLPFVAALPGFYFAFRKRLHDLHILTFSVLLAMTASAAAFAYVYLAGYTTDIRHLYLFVKLFYLLIFPLSVLAAAGFSTIFSKKYSALLYAVLILYAGYGATYAIYALPAKANFGGGFYHLIEYVYSIQGRPTVSIDESLIGNAGWRQGFPFDSFVDVPDTGYNNGGIAKVEALILLQHKLANTSIRDFSLVDATGVELVKYSPQPADLHITDKKVEGMQLAAQFGVISLYALH